MDSPAFWQILFSRFRGQIGRRRTWKLEIGVALTGATELVGPLCSPSSVYSQRSLLILGVKLCRGDSPSAT